MARYLLELSLCEYVEVRERASVLAAPAALLTLHSYQMDSKRHLSGLLPLRECFRMDQH